MTDRFAASRRRIRDVRPCRSEPGSTSIERMRPEARPPELGRSECLELLEEAAVGRVALTLDALPVIVPVAFTMAEGGIEFRVLADSRVADAVTDAVVAFQADGFDSSGQGWTVLAQGRAEPVGGGSSGSPRRSGEEADADHHRRLRIVPPILSGRRVVLGAQPPSSRADPRATPIPPSTHDG